MWLTKPRMIVLEIPKCGSTSLHRAAEVQYGKRYIKLHGHRTLQAIISELSQSKKAPQLGEVIDVVAVVRNPLDRMVSQVTNYMKIKKASSSDALRACAEQSHIIFKPQYKFLEGMEFYDYLNVKVYPIERIKDAQEHIMGRKIESALHYNSSERKAITKETLKLLDGFEEAYSQFQFDEPLYDLAKLT